MNPEVCQGGIDMVDTGVVMPLYKQDIGYLQAAISSVLAQSYGAFRFIIVIDGAPEMVGPAFHAAGGTRVFS